MEGRKNMSNQRGQEQGNKPGQGGTQKPGQGGRSDKPFTRPTPSGVPNEGRGFRGTANQESEADDTDDERDNVASPAWVATRKSRTRNPA